MSSTGPFAAGSPARALLGWRPPRRQGRPRAGCHWPTAASSHHLWHGDAGEGMVQQRWPGGKTLFNP